MTQWPHDDNASLIAFYGDPSAPGWQAANCVPVVPPWPMFYGPVAVKHIMFHKLAAPALTRIFAAIALMFPGDAINQTGLQNYSGAFNCRTVRGNATKLSCHEFDAAIDFDAEHEPMNFQHISHMAAGVIAAFDAEGAGWGGRFITRQDPMHFQFAREAS